MFAIFMLFLLFGNLLQQILPQFVAQRALFEVRERPAKTYSWKAFMLSNILVELPWQTLMAVIIFVEFYYPIGLYKNAEVTHSVKERGALFFLLVEAFLVFTSTFAQMIIAGMENAETAANIAQLMFSLTLIFCGYVLRSQSRSFQNPANFDPQSTCNAGNASRLLDLPLSFITIYVSCQLNAHNGRGQHECRVRSQRDTTFPATSWPDLFAIYGTMDKCSRGLPHTRLAEFNKRVRVLCH